MWFGFFAILEFVFPLGVSHFSFVFSCLWVCSSSLFLVFFYRNFIFVEIGRKLNVTISYDSLELPSLLWKFELLSYFDYGFSWPCFDCRFSEEFTMEKVKSLIHDQNTVYCKILMTELHSVKDWIRLVILQAKTILSKEICIASHESSLPPNNR